MPQQFGQQFKKIDIEVAPKGNLELLSQREVTALTDGAQHDALQDEILDLGYFGVPTYVIDDEVYFGREHLPRIRWHLAGKPGPLPDIAYDYRADA